jgi:hypothetical protein
MRIVVLLLCALSAAVAAQGGSSTYYHSLIADKGIWCGYSDHAEFIAQEEIHNPGNDASVIYSSTGELREISYDSVPHSGDWRIVDTYTPLGKGVLRLVWENALGIDRVNVVQDANIREGKAEPFRIKSVTTQGDGKPTKVDLSKI